MSLALTSTIHRLEQYKGSSFPILSVYLPIPKRETPGIELYKSFQSLLVTEINDEKRRRMEEDIDYVEAFLRQFDNRRKQDGLAVFSGGNKVWEALTLHFTVPSILRVEQSPFLEPLYGNLDTYKRYVVVIADREKARFFTLYLGSLESQMDVKDESVPQKVRAQGSPELESRIDRHIQDHLHKHFDSISEQVDSFVGKLPVSGVVVGGHKEIIHTLEKHLPKRLQKKIIGEMTADPGAEINDLVSRSCEVVEKVNKHFPKRNNPRFTPM